MDLTTVITNTTIVTGNPARTVLHHAGIAITEDRIASVGPTGEVEQRGCPSSNERRQKAALEYKGYVLQANWLEGSATSPTRNWSGPLEKT